MGFLQVLHQFENEIINNVCKEVRPEDMLTKTYIANAFLEFVKNLEVEEDDTYYLRWYEEEHNKNSKLKLRNNKTHSGTVEWGKSAKIYAPLLAIVYASFF